MARCISSILLTLPLTFQYFTVKQSCQASKWMRWNDMKKHGTDALKCINKLRNFINHYVD